MIQSPSFQVSSRGWQYVWLQSSRNLSLFTAGPVAADLTKMPSQMEHAMETMMFTFHKFAGDKGYLTKEDLRVLMEKEFPGFLEVSAERLGGNRTHSPGLLGSGALPALPLPLLWRSVLERGFHSLLC